MSGWRGYCGFGLQRNGRWTFPPLLLWCCQHLMKNETFCYTKCVSFNRLSIVTLVSPPQSVCLSVCLSLPGSGRFTVRPTLAASSEPCTANPSEGNTRVYEFKPHNSDSLLSFFLCTSSPSTDSCAYSPSPSPPHWISLLNIAALLFQQQKAYSHTYIHIAHSIFSPSLSWRR